MKPSSLLLLLPPASSLSMSTPTLKSWKLLRSASLKVPVGSALEGDSVLRSEGKGSPHVSNTLRLHSSSDVAVTLYRDQAGWCPYCEKTVLMCEEKKIPMRVELVPMRSYGDKPREFMRMVPNGLLPALGVDLADGEKRVITESGVIMELLDRMYPPSQGHPAMMPTEEEGVKRHQRLSGLERDLFGKWCQLLFRPEMDGGLFQIVGRGGQREAFLECMTRVDKELRSTPGPWFFDGAHPMMIDFVFVSHVERMLASCAYWKGMVLRKEQKFPGLCAWMDAFDGLESYLAFKSDFYTNVEDIPPQYGPAYFSKGTEAISKAIDGKDGSSWHLPLPHDDPFQPLYKGPPLPICALQAADLHDYQNSPPPQMARACRHAAAWKLASNGPNVAAFAARGGARGSKNPRKTFQAPLADPYAQPDEIVLPRVDAALRVVCDMMLDEEEDHQAALEGYRGVLAEIEGGEGVVDSLVYLRDRIGVPRDMPLAAARHFRAHLNWVMDVLKQD